MFSNKLVLGYFGDVTDQIDGQTIKTNSVYSLFNDHYKKISKFDTQKLQYSKYSYFVLLCKLIFSREIIWLPGKNNIKGLSLFIYLLMKFCNKRVYLFAVGGWLNEFLEDNNNNKIRKHFSLIEIVYVESNHLKLSLESNQFFKKVILFPNFRQHSFNIEVKKELNEFKIVFMARVMREKGCDILFDIIKYYNNKIENKKVVIDIYGPIQAEYKKDFEIQLKGNSNIFYKDIIRPEDVYIVLSDYDVCVLPTYYEGEGFPGTIIDSYISGIPVIVSNWKFLSEFVDNGVSGYVYDTFEELLFRIDQLINNQDLLLHLKKGAGLQSIKYSYESALKIIKETIKD